MSISSIQDLIIKAENYFKTIDVYNELDYVDVLEPLYVTLDDVGREFHVRNKQTVELFGLGNVDISDSVSMKEIISDDKNALYDSIKFIMPSVVFYYWIKSSKTIYEFDKVMLEQLMDTEDIELHKEIFDYLPVNTFIISTPNYGNYDAILVHIDKLPDDDIPNIIYTVGLSKNSKREQSLINKNRDGMLSLGITNKYIEFLQKSIIQREPCWFRFKDGTKLSEFRNKVNLHNMELLKNYKDEQTDQCIEINNNLYDSIKIGILCSYYLCAKNAIIQPRKIKKNMRKARNNGNKLNFNFNVCGVVQGSKFVTQDKQYTNYNETSQTLNDNVPKKKMPHIRRAHWHHYWVGNKDSIDRHLELRWIEPMIINADDFGKAPSITHSIDD